MFDLIVIGAGPAGASAAIRAVRSGSRVLLLEKGKFPRNKVCGEFVSAESLTLLAWLLDSTAKDLLDESDRIPSFRCFSDGYSLACPLDPPAASIARFDLDSALWQAALNSGVDCREQTPVKAVNGDGPFIVISGDTTFESRTVINASGRWSSLTASVQEVTRSRRRWLGVKAHFWDPEPSPSVDLYFFDGGYCGVSPVTMRGNRRERRINVCSMVQADVASTLSEVFDRHPLLKERSVLWRQVTDQVTTSPLIFRDPRATEGNVLLAGDAAGFVDPFSGDGISLALRTGELAADALHGVLTNTTSLSEAVRAYRRRYRQRFTPVFRTSSMIRPFVLTLPRVRAVSMAVFHRLPPLLRFAIRHTR